jgi:Transposase DDE domain
MPKARYRFRNWADYDRGLVRRGDIRVWLSQDAISGWRAACLTRPGGQRRFSNLSIETTLVLGAVMHLPLRRTECFLRSLMVVMKLDLAVSDHRTLAQPRQTVDVCESSDPRQG